MNSKVERQAVISMIWYMNKLARFSMQGVYVDEQSLSRMRGLLNENNRVVLLPTYKS